MADAPEMKDAPLALRALKDRESSDASGWRRVAVLQVSLGQELAANLMKDLDSDEVEQIAKAIADLKTVPREVQEQVVAEFEQQLASSRFPASGGKQVARGLLEAALGKDKALEMFARLGHGAKSYGFGMLDNVDPAQVSTLLTQIDAEKAAGLLNRLPGRCRRTAPAASPPLNLFHRRCSAPSKKRCSRSCPMCFLDSMPSMDPRLRPTS